ncbi:transmembrane protein, putative [Rhizoctonia solani AG-3 Rhs1AP]|nr:transmembrane protein, putative [Rhizoctonia solani AG-3 Rhs1AP]
MLFELDVVGDSSGGPEAMIEPPETPGSCLPTRPEYKKARDVVATLTFLSPSQLPVDLTSRYQPHSFKMLFSRFLFIALAAVGVVAQSAYPEKGGMVKLPIKLSIRDTPSAYESAIDKLKDYQEQTTDAMAGPPSEREAKLVVITGRTLEAVKEYNNDFKSKFSLFDLSNIAKGGQMSTFGRKLYVILRSCKGIRSDALYNNVHAIGEEIDSMGDFMEQKLPKTLSALVLPAFGKYSDRVDMIVATTKTHEAAA